ncbi:MAG: DUF692 domain-containing protein [Proteobacteria bacterium]|nr:DUF692 domain-containing protein [Pseudomonadota bacterium]
MIRVRPPFAWFEVIAEDFADMGGWAREAFEEIAKHYRIIPHGVALSIGSTDQLDRAHLGRIKKFLRQVKAPWYSDHLCFTMVDHTNLENLIPVPFTQEAVSHIAERVKVVQQELEVPFLLENVTRYITVSDREMPEHEFINSILEQADCGLLLDVTNVHLNSLYHHFDPEEFIRKLSLERVGKMHLAGWEEHNGTIIDSHDAPVPPEVWNLAKKVLAVTGPTSVLVEWDKSLPSVERLLQEAQMADALVRSFARSHEVVVEQGV